VFRKKEQVKKQKVNYTSWEMVDLTAAGMTSLVAEGFVKVLWERAIARQDQEKVA
jgi:hypothetical protein